jgi:excisionase family DNA binding protein
MGAPSPATDQEGEVWVTAGVAAQMLRVNVGTIRRYAAADKIAHARTLGGHTRFLLADLEALQKRLTRKEPAA